MRYGRTNNRGWLRGLGRAIMIDYFHYGGKRNLDDLAVCPFNLECRRREGLSCLHAPHNAPHAMTVVGDDFDIPLAVQWLER
jgi:hypothetical protein